eukprot:1190904-Prorocentrum_minimum.AAC.3
MGRDFLYVGQGGGGRTRALRSSPPASPSCGISFSLPARGDPFDGCGPPNGSDGPPPAVRSTSAGCAMERNSRGGALPRECGSSHSGSAGPTPGRAELPGCVGRVRARESGFDPGSAPNPASAVATR